MLPSSPDATLMFAEAAEAAEVVARQRRHNRTAIQGLGRRLREMNPRAIVTLARGSSDHAATFARYLIETRAGVLTSSASPSIASIYESSPDFGGAVVLAISQSGRSPDLLAAAVQAADSGALLVAIVNDEQSPLAEAAEIVIPLVAGRERSVAATKSFIGSLVAVLDLLAAWTEDPSIDAHLTKLPDRLAQAWSLDWTSALPALIDASALYVIGRGPGLGIAQEAALKFKETCGIQAEAFSAAEVRHGPMAVVRPEFPVLLFGQTDAGLDSVAALAADFESRAARLISAGVPGAPGIQLPVIPCDPVIEPVLQIASFYRLCNALSVARRLDPDRPASLAKVTETL